MYCSLYIVDYLQYTINNKQYIITLHIVSCIAMYVDVLYFQKYLIKDIRYKT